eukprot:3782464-Rhodomonas_salina.1
MHRDPCAEFPRILRVPDTQAHEYRHPGTLVVLVVVPDPRGRTGNYQVGTRVPRVLRTNVRRSSSGGGLSLDVCPGTRVYPPVFCAAQHYDCIKAVFKNRVTADLYQPTGVLILARLLP